MSRDPLTVLCDEIERKATPYAGGAIEVAVVATELLRLVRAARAAEGLAAEALAWAIEAGRMRGALAYVEWEDTYLTMEDGTKGAEWQQCVECMGHRDDAAPHRGHDAKCGVGSALAPAAPEGLSVREWLAERFRGIAAHGAQAAATVLVPGAVVRGIDYDPTEHIAIALSSAPSPSPASRLRAEAAMLAIEAVNVREALPTLQAAIRAATGGVDARAAACRFVDAKEADEAAHAAAVAALAACDKEEK